MLAETLYLTPKVIAEVFDVARQTVTGWIRKGVPTAAGQVKLAATKAGKQWRVKPADLEAFLSATTGDAVAIAEREQERRRDQLHTARRLKERLGRK